MIERARKRLNKRAKRGFRGWPLATVALYGPDDTMATKLTVGILRARTPRRLTFDVGFRRTRPTSATTSGWRKKCWRSSPRPEPSRLSWRSGLSAAPMKKASTTRVQPVRLVRSGQDATAGPASACTKQNPHLAKVEPFKTVLTRRLREAREALAARGGSDFGRDGSLERMWMRSRPT